MDKPKEKKIAFIDTEDTLSPVYTNIIKVEVSLLDVVLKLGIRDSELAVKNQCKHIVDVYLSPEHAKALTKILNKHLEVYEKTHGAIPQGKEEVQVEE